MGLVLFCERFQDQECRGFIVLTLTCARIDTVRSRLYEEAHCRNRELDAIHKTHADNSGISTSLKTRGQFWVRVTSRGGTLPPHHSNDRRHRTARTLKPPA